MTLKHRIILIVINDRIKVKQFSYKIYSLNNYGYLATEFIKKMEQKTMPLLIDAHIFHFKKIMKDSGRLI